MEKVSGSPTLPDISANEQASRELIKRIRKLRWIGLEQEAQHAQMTLCRIASNGSVLTVPRDTD